MKNYFNTIYRIFSGPKGEEDSSQMDNIPARGITQRTIDFIKGSYKVLANHRAIIRREISLDEVLSAHDFPIKEDNSHVNVPEVMD